MLERNCVLDGFFKMDSQDPIMAKKALEFLKRFKADVALSEAFDD